VKRLAITRNAEGWLCEYANRKAIRISDLTSVTNGRVNTKYALALKGTFGAGKSTLFNTLLARDPDHCYLTADMAETKPMGTFLPRYNTAIIGTYLNACGGCDGLAPRMVQQYLRLIWPYDVHILYEGAIVAGIISTFYELTKKLREEHYREVCFCFLKTSVEACIRRIYERNAGKPFKEANVAAKNRSIWRAYEVYTRQGDVQCSVLNTDGSKEEVLERFLCMYPELDASQAQPGDKIESNRRAA
jgi:hypothetical protein